MPWTAPRVERVEGPFAGNEREVLQSCLEWHRATLLTKCAGLTGEQLARRPVPPSDLSLLGLLRHAADAERAWFRRHLLGHDLPEVHARRDAPDAAFTDLDPDQAARDHRALLDEQEASRAAALGVDLRTRCVDARWSDMTLHAVYVHMIEEYARHNGHADLVRQAIDGATGE